MSKNFTLMYNELKNKSNEIFIEESEKLNEECKNFLRYIIFNYDLNILGMNNKNKDYEICFNIRNNLIIDIVDYYKK
jgi:hypothetical protein